MNFRTYHGTQWHVPCPGLMSDNFDFFSCFKIFPTFLESTVNRYLLFVSLTSEVGYLRNLSAMLCLHNSRGKTVRSDGPN